MAYEGEDFELDATRQAEEAVGTGMHLCEIASVEKKTSNTSGNEYLNWRLTVIGSNDPDYGKSLWHMTSLTPQSRWKLEQFLDAVRAPEGKLRVSKLVGRKLKAEVAHEEFEGKTRARVTNVSADIGESGAKPRAPKADISKEVKEKGDIPF